MIFPLCCTSVYKAASSLQCGRGLLSRTVKRFRFHFNIQDFLWYIRLAHHVEVPSIFGEIWEFEKDLERKDIGKKEDSNKETLER